MAHLRPLASKRKKQRNKVRRSLRIYGGIFCQRTAATLPNFVRELVDKILPLYTGAKGVNVYMDENVTVIKNDYLCENEPPDRTCDCLNVENGIIMQNYSEHWH